MASGWTTAKMEELVKAGKFKAQVTVHQEARLPDQYRNQKITLPKVPVNSPKGLSHIKGILTMLQVKFETEYRFDSVRKFRFDIAVPGMMLAIEYEGIFSAKSGHTTAGGYIKDCEKYNLATVQGWRILRYTGNNYKDFIRDFNKLRNDEQH